MNAWISPKTIIGNVATGKYFFSRDEIIEDIWIELNKGNSLLLAAPRRVGKTSILRAIEENPKNGYIVKFEILQGIKTKEEFYKIMYQLILTCFSKLKKFTIGFSEYLKKRKISEIDFKNFKFKIESIEIDYLQEINELFLELNNNTEKIILLLDELPEVLHNINKDGNNEDAKEILKQIRVWRQNDYENIQFVFAGSIGIHYVVEAITGRMSDLNDLNIINCLPLTKKQALDYIHWATEEATIQYNEELKKYLLGKIEYYYTPYFINLMLNKIDNNGRKTKNKEITKQEIDIAFNLIVKDNANFEDWFNRLKDYMPKEDFLFVNNILIHISHKGFITVQNIYNKAIKYNKEIEYMSLISNLIKDGYIIEDPNNPKKYIFISSFLKTFWFNNNPIYNE